MTPFVETLLLAFLGCELLSLALLRVGARMGRCDGWLRRVGRRAYRRKIDALRSTWPLDRLPQAVQRRNLPIATLILVPLVLGKSVLMLPLGLVALPWLPFASLVVPVIVTAHRSDPDRELEEWGRSVARLQITSHVAAAAVGFALTWHGPLAGEPPTALLAAHPLPLSSLLGLSVLTGVAAGWREAVGVVVHDFLGLRDPR